MTTNTPKNHHFVPIHFLQAWQAPEKKIYRYRYITHIDKFEIKDVGIKNTASKEFLYTQKYPDGEFQIEESVMQLLLDGPGSKTLDMARKSSVSKWNEDDKRELAVYLVCLEARHPEIIDVLNVKPHLDELRADLKEARESSDESVDYVVDDLDQLDSMGVIMLEALIRNEKGSGTAAPLADSLINAHFREYEFDTPLLITSDYPTGRWGNHGKEMFFSIAISPTKALVYATDIIAIQAIDSLSKEVLAKLVNFYTLANATVGYYFDKSQGRFVFEHLGWKKKFDLEKEHRSYLEQFLKSEILSSSHQPSNHQKPTTLFSKLVSFF